MNSGSSVEPVLSTDESSNNASTPSTPMPLQGVEPGFPLSTPPAAFHNKAFKFPKTKKVFIMSFSFQYIYTLEIQALKFDQFGFLLELELLLIIP